MAPSFENIPEDIRNVRLGSPGGKTNTPRKKGKADQAFPLRSGISNGGGDTIAAPATAPVPAAISIVRLSGPDTQRIIRELCRRAEQTIRQPRMLTYSSIRDLIAGDETEILDRGLICFFAKPHSFTGEDVCEFQLHGSPFLVERLLENLNHLGARMARPGEFTERAFLNGKMDLSQAEAIGDLIVAETEAQARVASEQLEGKLSHAVSRLGEPLRDLVAEIEAQIDFPEEDIEPESSASWCRVLENSTQQLEQYISSFQTGRLYREGAQVTIIGLPNAGKSSLLNKLVGEDRVIVTAHAGTTRDSIEERVSLEGLQLHFWDTAGLAEGTSSHPTDEIEQLGIERSWRRLQHADVVLYVLDGMARFGQQIELFTRVSELAAALMVVVNKRDLLNPEVTKELGGQIEQQTGNTPIFVSALTGEGVFDLQKALHAKLISDGQYLAPVLVTNRRHVEALMKARKGLSRAIQAIEGKAPPELVVVDLREALGALDDIIGVTHTEDILGRIFSKFCIGK